MRLTPMERAVLKGAVESSFGPGTTVRVFGSRVDDSRRGGDIDLLVETSLQDPQAIVSAKTRLLATLYTHMGEQKFDVLVDYPGREQGSPIWAVAKQQGVAL